MPRQFSEQTYLAIKAAFRDLVKASGGQSSAVEHTRACQSSLSKACSPNHMDSFPTIDQVADLEAEAGSLAMTKLLAGLAGYDLVPRVAAPSSDTMMTDAAKMSLAFGDMQAKFITAMHDGHMSPVERVQLKSAVNELREPLNAFDLQLDTAPTVRVVRA